MSTRQINRLVVFLCVTFVTVVCFAQYAVSEENPDELVVAGKKLEEKTFYKKAYAQYLKAHDLFVEKSDKINARKALESMYGTERKPLEYPLSQEEVKTILAKNFSDVSDKERAQWISSGKLDHLIVDGNPQYFCGTIDNIRYRNIDLMRAYTSKEKKTNPFYEKLKDIVFKDKDSGYPREDWRPYINPVTFLYKGSMTIPRKELPAKGVLKLWVPLPVQTQAQSNIKIINVEPSEYIKAPYRTDTELGQIYIEVPLDELKSDLSVEAVYMFTHYEKRFVIDPDAVGDYDKNDALYKKYTKSSPSILVSPDVCSEAKRAVGNIDNPYRAAKKLYQYVLNNIAYSLMPHIRLAAEQMSESEFVFKNRYGDCGSQSMYFCALCRSLGIPARAIGGQQLIPGVAGDHFWAEFYLPNYGWIPVDTTIAETVNYFDDISEADKKAFKEYFFGNMDPYRLVFQKDVDAPLIPAPSVRVSLPMAIQEPAAVCETAPSDPGILVDKYWKFKVSPVE